MRIEINFRRFRYFRRNNGYFFFFLIGRKIVTRSISVVEKNDASKLPGSINHAAIVSFGGRDTSGLKNRMGENHGEMFCKFPRGMVTAVGEWSSCKNAHFTVFRLRGIVTRDLLAGQKINSFPRVKIISLRIKILRRL